MADIPADALTAAEEAYVCAHQSGVPDREIARIVVAAAEEGIRADERRKVADEIRALARWEMQGGYIDLFPFKDRHDRLAHIDATHLSMAFRALADEIEGEARDSR